MNHRLKILLLLLVGVLFQSGCSTEAAYTGESFSSDSPFKLRVDSDIDAACESARRSLLGQGYLIDTASSEEVKARKAARVEGKQNAFIEMTVVCVPERGGATIFATGVLSTYDLKKNSSSASVGLSALGSISLPIGQSVDSLVKVSEQTIDDKEFYKRFFTAVETILGEMRIREADDDSAAESATQSAAPQVDQPVSQPRIWPELFPEQATSAAPQPAAGQAASEAMPVVAPAPAPAPVAPVTAPEVSPVVSVPSPGVVPAPAVNQTSPGVVPAPAVNETSPGVVPAPAVDETSPGVVPAPAVSVTPTGAVPAPAVSVTPSEVAPAPAVSAPPPAIPPTPVAAEPPPAMVPTTVPDATPVEPGPAVSTAPTISTVAVPELAPIQVTAVRKKLLPIPAAAEQPAPVVVPQDPAVKIEGLF